MGYYIEVEGDIKVRADNVQKLHDLLKSLLTDEKHQSEMHGGSSGGGVVEKRWFSWCNGAEPDQPLPELIENMRWGPTFDSEGNLSLSFLGQKLGEEEYILNVLAPAIDPATVLTVTGEEGYRWEWRFDGTRLIEFALPRVYRHRLY